MPRINSGDEFQPPGPDEPMLGYAPHFRTHNDWFEDPWATPEVKAARKTERHGRWIAMLSARDWERLAERADAILAGGHFARFSDLDAPIDVGVVDATETHPPNGERFGMLRGCVLMAFQRHGAG